MTIIRVDKSAGRWEAIPVALINDARLSLDTRGFAAWLMTRGNNWKVQAEALPHLLDIGREKARRLIRELEGGGYLARSCVRGAGGRWIWTSTFTPTPAAAAVDGFPVDGRTVDGSTPDGCSTDGCSTDGKPVGKDKTRCTTRLRTTTTARSGREVAEGALQIPAILSGDFLGSTLGRLRGCPAELRQLVLDEIAGLDDQSAIRGNPVALLSSLISRAAEGNFVPAAGVVLKRAKEKRDAQRRQAQIEQMPAAPPTVEQREAIRQRLQDLRASLMKPKTPSVSDSRVANPRDASRQVPSTSTERKSA